MVWHVGVNVQRVFVVFALRKSTKKGGEHFLGWMGGWDKEPKGYEEKQNELTRYWVGDG